MLNNLAHTFGAILLTVVGGVFLLLGLASAIRALEHGQVSKFAVEAVLILVAGWLLFTLIRDAMPWAFTP